MEDHGRNIGAFENSPMSFPAQNNREFIWTFSGRKFFFDKPESCIAIQDIAHAMSMLCRWTGHVRFFYSIAEHCVRASKLPVVASFPLRALLHDAAEAYVNDLNKPLKNLIRGEYDVIEARIERAIWLRYGLTPDVTASEAKAVKEADLTMAMTEARDLLGQVSVAHYEGARPLKEKIETWSQLEAEERFLERFKELM